MPSIAPTGIEIRPGTRSLFVRYGPSIAPTGIEIPSHVGMDGECTPSIAPTGIEIGGIAIKEDPRYPLQLHLLELKCSMNIKGQAIVLTFNCTYWN